MDIVLDRVDAVKRDHAILFQIDHREAACRYDLVSDASIVAASAEIVADLMINEGTGRIPVVDLANGRLVGIVARQDLLRVQVTHRRSEAQRERLAW